MLTYLSSSTPGKGKAVLDWSNVARPGITGLRIGLGSRCAISTPSWYRGGAKRYSPHNHIDAFSDQRVATLVPRPSPWLMQSSRLATGLLDASGRPRKLASQSGWSRLTNADASADRRIFL